MPLPLCGSSMKWPTLHCLLSPSPRQMPQSVSVLPGALQEGRYRPTVLVKDAHLRHRDNEHIMSFFLNDPNFNRMEYEGK